jgi:hypothetical protein
VQAREFRLLFLRKKSGAGVFRVTNVQRLFMMLGEPVLIVRQLGEFLLQLLIFTFFVGAG